VGTRSAQQDPLREAGEDDLPIPPRTRCRKPPITRPGTPAAARPHPVGHLAGITSGQRTAATPRYPESMTQRDRCKSMERIQTIRTPSMSGIDSCGPVWMAHADYPFWSGVRALPRCWLGRCPGRACALASPARRCGWEWWRFRSGGRRAPVRDLPGDRKGEDLQPSSLLLWSRFSSSMALSQKSGAYLALAAYR
jgi:hypothetical protein